MKGVQMNRWLLAFLYLLVFVLLREWLLPVMELTKTGYLSLFLIFIGLAFLLALVDVRWWLSVPVKVGYILWATHYIHIGQVIGTRESVKMLSGNLATNFPVLIGGNWEDISNPFRTILFFVLLWMTTYLLRHWIEVRKSIFLFYCTTVVFIAVIDTFSNYSAGGSIFRVMVVGLLSLGLLSISRLADKHGTPIPTRTFSAISVPLVFVVVASGVFATILPKQEPVWRDPVPYLKSMVGGIVEGEDGEAIAKSGYSPDDSRLGGPFLVDQSPVFEAVVDKKQYWKIETKDTYTSKGWEQSDIGEQAVVYYPGMEMGESSGDGGLESSEKKLTELTMTEKFPFIIYPYGMKTVTTEQDILILNRAASGEYRTEIRNKEQALDAYTIEYTERQYSLKALRETTMSSLQSLGGFEEYLQLPDTLPDRVAELAESITVSNESVYDKAKAIERYYGREGFVYDQKNVKVPEEDEDYVDQFLFDTKRGYCDNYSTSMVVMLRTIGIPARWVKGFAPGEATRNENGDRVYQVTNEEAHSWVEAYMPGIGWMPFEPTVGFNGVTSIDYDIEMTIDDPEVPEMPQEEREKIERESSEEKVKAQDDFELGKLLKSVNDWMKGKVVWLLVGIVVLLWGAWMMSKGRRKWFPKRIAPLYQSDTGDWATYSKQYKNLLQRLDRYGLKRMTGETLSIYATKVDQHFGGQQMTELTIAYEKGIYGESRESQDWQRLQEMWEDLINRTSD